MDIPTIKKKVKAFLASEEGRISKDKLLKGGLILGTIAFSTAVAAHDHHANFDYHQNTYDPADCPGCLTLGGGTCHQNSIELVNQNGVVTTQHQHCVETHTLTTKHYSHHSDHNDGGPCGW